MPTNISDWAISVLAGLATSIPTFFIPLNIAKVVAPNTITSGIGKKGFLKKKQGVFLILLGIVITVMIYAAIESWIADRYANNLLMVALGYASILPLLCIAIMIYARYKISWKSGLVYSVGVFVCINAFGYSLGFDVWQFYASVLSQSQNVTSAPNSP